MLELLDINPAMAARGDACTTCVPWSVPPKRFFSNTFDQQFIAKRRCRRPSTSSNHESINVPAALFRLKAALHPMEAAQRREAISKMPSRVRMALLAFMEGGFGPHASQTATAAALTKTLKQPVSSRDRLSLDPASSQDIGLMIIRREYQRKYKARVYFNSLCLSTLEQSDLEVARKQQHMLMLIRSEVLSETRNNPSFWNNTAEVLDKCKSILVASHASEDRIGLRACVMMRAGPWLAPRDRIISPTMTLADALHVRARLVEARARSWDAFRIEWIGMMLQGSRTLTMPEAAVIADGRRCRALEHKVALAICNAERMLGSDDRIIMRKMESRATPKRRKDGHARLHSNIGVRSGLVLKQLKLKSYQQ